MIDLFRDYWWLVFPMGFMAMGTFRAYLRYRTQREVVRALRDLAEKGREPPAALVGQLER